MFKLCFWMAYKKKKKSLLGLSALELLNSVFFNGYLAFQV